MKKKLIFALVWFLFLCFVCSGTTSLIYIWQDQIDIHGFPFQQKWDFEAKGQIRTTPIIHNNKVFVAGGRELYGIDASNGNLVWSAILPDSIIANPTVHDNTLIVSYVGGVRAFNAKTGEQLWELENSAYRPMVANDKYVVFRSYRAMVHDIETGELIWSVGEPYPGPFAIAVALDDNNLYVIFENQICSYDIKSRQILWKEVTDEWSSYEGLLTEDVFYLKHDEKGITAYDFKQRKVLWSRDDLDLSSYPISQQGQTVFLGTNGDAPVAVDAQTGKIIWVANELNSLDDYQTPLVVGDLVYIRGLFLKRIYALDKHTGRLLGYIKLGVPDIVSANAQHSLGPVQFEDLIIFSAGKHLLAYEEK